MNRSLTAAVEDARFRLEWLSKEVDLLEQKIEAFDSLSFKIKGWAVTIWSAMVSVAVTRSSWQLASLSLIVLAVFLVTDASYKRYQLSFIERSRDVMRFLNDAGYREEWADRAFPIYDLLNIHTRSEEHDPLNERWGSVLEPLSKASVGMVYWALAVVSVAVTVMLAWR